MRAKRRRWAKTTNGVWICWPATQSCYRFSGRRKRWFADELRTFPKTEARPPVSLDQGGDMNQTPISWCTHSWNPTTGCFRVSPGCAHCYMFAIAEPKRGTKAFPNGADLTYRWHK